jgi:DNA-binding LacI/PurR family transcriptional regulator
MKKKKTKRVSIREIARVAGLSPSQVSYALQNRPRVKKATRDRVLRIAKTLGYNPDPRLSSWMTQVREAKEKDLLPIAWLNTLELKDAWQRYKFLSPSLEGAQKRAEQLGYRLEEFWLHEPGMTMARLSRILYQRGIEGVIVTPPAKHIRLDWKHIAGVGLGSELLAPRLHQVGADVFYNMYLALKMAERFGYRRLGVCLAREFDSYSLYACRAAVRDFQATRPKLDTLPPLFYTGHEPHERAASKRQIAEWLERHRPDFIVCHSNYMKEWVESAGLRVPEDIGIAHLATDDDVSDWAGTNAQRRDSAAFAVELVVSQIQARQFGIPKIARRTLMRGVWHGGKTLLIPKPRPKVLTRKKRIAAA